MAEELLQVSGLNAFYGATQVLFDVSFRLRGGEITAILGANGAGKSVLVGLLTHHERAVPHHDGTPAVRVLGQDGRPVLDSVSLEIGHGNGGPRRFTVVPPATFG